MGQLVKSSVDMHTVVINGRKTSVSLEEAFWNDLKQIAHAQGVTVSELVTKIDQTREGGLSPRQFACSYSNIILLFASLVQ